MHIRLLRHATVMFTIHHLKILVDPMLCPLEAMDPIVNAGHQWRIPMVPLPLSDEELQQLIGSIDGVLVTHPHMEHWDANAQAMVPKQLPLLCQPENQDTGKRAGFSQVLPVADTLS